MNAIMAARDTALAYFPTAQAFATASEQAAVASTSATTASNAAGAAAVSASSAASSSSAAANSAAAASAIVVGDPAALRTAIGALASVNPSSSGAWNHDGPAVLNNAGSALNVYRPAGGDGAGTGPFIAVGIPGQYKSGLLQLSAGNHLDFYTGNGSSAYVLGLRLTTEQRLLVNTTIDDGVNIAQFAGPVGINTGGVATLTLGNAGNYGVIASGGYAAAIYLNGAARGGAAGTGTADGAMVFATNETVRFSNASVNVDKLTLDTSGNLLVGATSTYGIGVTIKPTGEISSTYSGTSGNHCLFLNNNSTVGSIASSGSSTYYNTSSDYRLKTNVQPMQGALATVAQLRPVTYNWLADNSTGHGFIAHELQVVVPECVTGAKDAVGADGKPVYQGIDTSFLVGVLTAAIQELSTKLDAANDRIAKLEGVAA